MSLFALLRQYIQDEVPVAQATVISGRSGVGSKMLVRFRGETDGSIIITGLSERVAEDARRLLAEEKSQICSYGSGDDATEIFIDVFPVPPQLVIVGATHTAIPLSHFGKLLGFRVVVCDARAAFALPERFPDAERVLKGWPQDVLPHIRFDDNTYLVLLSHDPKFDEPTLDHVLPTPVRYIGAIGSRKTQRARFERLRQQGFSSEQLAKIYGPVGLDIGARSVEETALAILAEVTAVRHGKAGGFLRL